MTETIATSHGWAGGVCFACGVEEGTRPWAEACTQPSETVAG